MITILVSTVLANSSLIWTRDALAKYPGLVDSAYAREAIEVCYQPLAKDPCGEFFKAVEMQSRKLVQDGAEEDIKALACEKKTNGFVISYRMEMNHLSASENSVAIEKQLRMGPCDVGH